MKYRPEDMQQLNVYWQFVFSLGLVKKVFCLSTISSIKDIFKEILLNLLKFTQKWFTQNISEMF